MKQYIAKNADGQTVLITEELVDVDVLNGKLERMDKMMTESVEQRRALLDLLDNFRGLAPVEPTTPADTQAGGVGDMLPVEIAITPGEPNA